VWLFGGGGAGGGAWVVGVRCWLVGSTHGVGC